MRVLFASGIDGFCHRYAVLHWVEQLAGQGIAGTVRAHTDPRLLADLAEHDLLVLYRVPHGAWIEHLLGAARALGRATVFAIDDLIFDVALTDAPPLRRMDAAGRRLWHDGVARYRRTLLACDAFLTTTPPLVDAGRAAGKPTVLHRAGLGARELALGAAAMRAAATARAAAGATERDTTVRLGYWSGTPTHDDDFATIAPVLGDLLARAPAVELVLGGHLDVDPALTRFGARVRRLPFVPWPELPAQIAATDVNLAPLAWSDPFVAAKGAIKYLEAAAAGVPTIASPTEAFRDAIAHGRTGMIAADTREWTAALDALVGDQGVRRRLGAAARADVATRFEPGTQGRVLAGALRDIVARHAGGAGRGAPAASKVDEVALVRTFFGEVARAAREPHALPDFATPPATAATPPLADGVRLAQRVRAMHTGLTRLDVHTITYGLALDHTLALHVRRDDGTTVTQATLAAALVPDRDWLALEFPPEPRSAGRCYTLEIEARGTGSRNALTFGTSDIVGPEGPFTIDGTPGPRSLTLRAFAADEVAASGETAAVGV